MASTSSRSEKDKDEHRGQRDKDMDVPFDMGPVKTAIKGLRDTIAVPSPAQSRHPLQPPPARLLHKADGGDAEYFTYIPYWTDPDWDDKHHAIRSASKDGDRVEQLAKINEADRRRPALLPKDTLTNPTPYAQRWGVHPDHKADGRSCLSPTTSNSRRVGLSHNQDTPTGFKDYVTARDVKAAIAAMEPNLAKNTNASDSPWSHLEALSEQPGLWTEQREQMEAFKQLRTSVEHDEAYQRMSWQGLTTDERIAHGVHSLDDTSVKYDLDGPLHRLVERGRWCRPAGRSAAGAGQTRDKPRYHYNLFGMRGEWVADNDAVWMALQPALQLVTRVLNTNHPFWTALLDVRTRHPIDAAKMPQGVGWSKFSKYFDPAKPQRSTQHLHETLDAHGVDLVAAVASLLSDRLTLSLCEGTPEWVNLKGQRVTLVGDSTCFLGVTETPWAGNGDVDPGLTIRTGIAIEMIWPLLVPCYTEKEKTAASLAIAAVMLHEFAHAAHHAICILLQGNSKTITQLSGMSSPLHKTINDLGREVTTTTEIEPFYEDEPKQELGFSFENQMLGGSPRPAGLRLDHFEWVFLDMSLSFWPSPSFTPHDNWKDEALLRGCALPVDGLNVPLPADSYVKLFHQAFWDQQMGKYGHSALKLVPDKPTPTVLKRQYARKTDLTDTFGKARGEWLIIATSHLTELGLELISKYLRTSVIDMMESVWISKRWHWEKKAWPVRIKQLDRLKKDVQHEMTALEYLFNKINSLATEKADRVHHHNVAAGAAHLAGVYNSQSFLDNAGYARILVESATAQFSRLIGAYSEVHRHFLWEIRCAQNLVVDYVKQDVPARTYLWSQYGQLFKTTLEGFVPDTLEPMLQDLHTVRTSFSNANALSPDVDVDLQRFAISFQLDVNQLKHTSAFFEHANITSTSLDWQGRLETIPSGRARKDSERLRLIAIKEILKQPRPIRKLVETYLAIINQQDVLEKEYNAHKAAVQVERVAGLFVPNSPRKNRVLGVGKGMFNLPARRTTPKESGMARYKRRAETNPRPWAAAPRPPRSNPNIAFGHPSHITREPTPDPEPTEPTLTTAALSSVPGLPPLRVGNQDFSHPDISPPPEEVLPAAVRWGPFGTAWCDYQTITEEVTKAGHLNMPVPTKVLGQKVFERNRRKEKMSRWKEARRGGRG